MDVISRVSSLRFILSIFRSGAALVKMLVGLFLIWLTLDWKVRKARKAFENELMKHGMAKHDVERISAQYAMLKDNVESAFRQSLRRWR